MTKQDISLIIAPFTAVVVGFASSVAVVLAAMDAIGATQSQAASGLSAMCIMIAFSTLVLCRRYRLPLVTAWTLPGSAVMAAVTGVDYAVALMACLFVGILLILTAAVPVLSRLVAGLPMPIASAMLAGILFRFVVEVFPAINALPLLSLVVIGVFFIVRQWYPVYAVLLAMLTGGVLAIMLGEVADSPSMTLTFWQWTTPIWSYTQVINLAIPVYLVTMVSQNLTGAAVLHASGYQQIPSQPIVGLTGFCTAIIAPLGGLPVNLAAVTAAICTGEDCHADPAQRWRCGVYYALFYLLLALFAGGFVVLFASFPTTLITTIAGIALFAPFISALKQGVSDEQQLWPAVVTFLITCSGTSYGGLGAPFWGLLAGLALMLLMRITSAMHQ